MAYKQISPQSVVEGGTGAATLTGVLTGNGTSAITANAVTQYTVLLGGASNAVSEVSGVGTSGQVLTSNGAGMDPTWQDGASGDVTGPGSSTDNALARWNGAGGDTLQDSTVIVTDNGEMTNGSQPAFLAYQATTQSNATGNGTFYTLGSTTDLTEVFDQGGDFVHTTGIFTAPVTGNYYLCTKTRVGSVSSASTGELQIVTSNRTFINNSDPAAIASTGWNEILDVLADMDASDTATFRLATTGEGADTNTVIGSSDGVTYACGNLVC